MFQPWQRHTGSTYRIHIKVTTKVLAKLFNVHEGTIYRWIKQKKFDPTSMSSIIEYYNKNNNLHGETSSCATSSVSIPVPVEEEL
jgi:hypothetical protein